MVDRDDIKIMISSIACGVRFIFLLTSEGKLYVREQEDKIGRFNYLEQHHKVDKISCGRLHGCFQTEIGLYMIGSNYYGQLGINVDETKTPILLENSHNVTSFSCGFDHTIVCRGSQISSSGFGFWGQLGLGDFLPRRHFETLKLSLDGVIVLCCRDSSFLYNDEEVYVFGSNKFHQLGIDAECVVNPKRVIQDIGIVEVRSIVTSEPLMGITIVKTSTSFHYSMEGSFVRVATKLSKSARSRFY